MNYLAQAKIDTPVYELPGNMGNKLNTIKAGEQFKILDSEHIGLKTYYKTNLDGYVVSNDAVILRDDDYFYKNYATKNLVNRPLRIQSVSNGLGSVIGETNDILSNYNWLQQFADEDDWIVPVTPGIVSYPDTRREGYGIGLPDIFGDSNIGNTQLYDGDSKTNLLRGVSINDVLDGSAIEKIADNLIGNITGWIDEKLSYVIGFSSGSILSSFFKIFGTNFGTVVGFALNALFGGDLSSFLSPLDSFFNYQMVNGNKVWYNSSSGSWAPGQIKIARTGPIASEMKVWQDLADADYSELKDSLTLIKQEFNLDVGLNKDENIYTKFNRFRVPIPDHELVSSMGHIFFVRPDLNLEGSKKKSRVSAEGEASQSQPGYAHYCRLFQNILQANPTLAKQLTKDGFSGHNFMPVLTHACTGIDVADEVLETVETGETFVGWKYVYGTSMIKSKTAGTINITFADDNILSIYKIMKVWTEYIHAVRHGEIFPKDEYVMKHQLDYPTSIYYILTDHTGEAILFWTKYTGAFPISTPSSNFSDSLGNRITRPNYSIQFAYSRKDDFNPLHLEEFNRQSTGAFESNCIYNADTMRSIRSFTGAPFVDTTDGELTYRLRFRPPPSNA